MAGKYTGDWKSNGSGNGGAIRFTLEGPKAEIWHSELSFILDGADVPTIRLRRGHDRYQGTTWLDNCW